MLRLFFRDNDLVDLVLLFVVDVFVFLLEFDVLNLECLAVTGASNVTQVLQEVIFDIGDFLEV